MRGQDARRIVSLAIALWMLSLTACLLGSPSSPAASTGQADESTSPESSSPIPRPRESTEASGGGASQPPDPFEVMLTCGNPLPFSSAELVEPAHDETAGHPATELFRSVIAQEPHVAARDRWRTVVLTDRAALFLVEPRLNEDFAFWSVELENRAGEWRYVRNGQCNPRGWIGEGIETAEWKLAPGAALTGESRVIEVLVLESACASGQSAEGRIAPPTTVYHDDSIVVTFGTRPPPGPQTCQGSPPTPAGLELTEPLGDRVLLDGFTYPPAPRGRAP